MMINANATIDNLIYCLEDMKPYYKDIPRGSYITKESKYYDIAENYRNAERKISLISDITGIPENNLYTIARIARKWYEHYKWERCLPDQTACKLIEHYFLIEKSQISYYESTGRKIHG